MANAVLLTIVLCVAISVEYPLGNRQNGVIAMPNPYHGRPDFTFWKQSVTDCPAVDPVVSATFAIEKSDQIATAGSCFAQHIARTLVAEGYSYLVTERFEENTAATDENYGVFPARFANIYTVRQLIQLFQRAYGLSTAQAQFARGRQGGYVDLFRPRI